MKISDLKPGRRCYILCLGRYGEFVRHFGCDDHYNWLYTFWIDEIKAWVHVGAGEILPDPAPLGD